MTQCPRVLFALRVGLVVVCMAIVGAGCAPPESPTPEAQQLHDVNQNSPEGEAILRAATTDVDSQLGKPAQFSVQTFKASSGWAFLSTAQGSRREPVRLCRNSAGRGGGKWRRIEAVRRTVSVKPKRRLGFGDQRGRAHCTGVDRVGAGIPAPAELFGS